MTCGFRRQVPSGDLSVGAAPVAGVAHAALGERLRPMSHIGFSCAKPAMDARTYPAETQGGSTSFTSIDGGDETSP